MSRFHRARTQVPGKAGTSISFRTFRFRTSVHVFVFEGMLTLSKGSLQEESQLQMLPSLLLLEGSAFSRRLKVAAVGEEEGQSALITGLTRAR